MKSPLRIALTTCVFSALVSGPHAFAQAGAPPHPMETGPAPNIPLPSPADESRMDIRDTTATETLHILVGHSTVLRGISPLKRIYIGNPTVLSSFTAGPSEVVLTAKAAGMSSLVIWDTEGQSRLYNVSADLDPDVVRRALREAYPGANVDVDGTEGRIYLRGSVTSQAIADGMGKLVSPFSKDVINSLTIVPVHGKQVQLKLRIVEVDRSKSEQYGVNFSGLSSRTPFNVSTGQFPGSVTAGSGGSSSSGSGSGSSGGSSSSYTVGDMLNLFVYSTDINVASTIRALEQKQVLQILAEPTLTALSGQDAKFLAGGEFPFPVVQAGSAGSAPTISISFRPYGVNVAFTPTVNPDGTIRLKVAPEVSTLDYANAVSISGFTVPAISTRRADTEVEIRSGQTFALGGLLDHRTTEMMNQIPGISKIPILGKLFISKQYSHSVAELIVMVTATVVDPLTDNVAPKEPEMPLPNLDNQTFDRDMEKEKILHPKR